MRARVQCTYEIIVEICHDENEWRRTGEELSASCVTGKSRGNLPRTFGFSCATRREREIKILITLQFFDQAKL